ncbi:MAG TPA: pyruvate formate lyase family protein [Anaeromyxobacteraceae bacterium]|nr:pyruvate formate lyase family protein [Anaeromyxobacteraceae bacterium]
MADVTLRDVRLAEHDLDTLPRLAELRRSLLATPPEVCVERARHVTRYLREMSDPGEPMEVEYARAVRHFLERKEVLFPDRNLLAGTTTSKPVGAPVYPELTGLAIWPELDTISTRKHNPLRLSAADAAELDTEIFPYWMDRSILEVARPRLADPTPLRVFERIIFFLASKAGTVSHTVPSYRAVLERGLDALIADAAAREEAAAAAPPSADAARTAAFYRAVQIALEGIIAYARHLSARARALARCERDPRRAHELQAMAEVCARVPARPPRTFREAVNAVWLAHIAFHAENINMAMSPGRLDQVLYPFYRADRAAGRLTDAEAIELVGCLWLKLNDNVNLVPETAEELFGGAGTVPAVTVGGVAEDGSDAVNDLTYVMLRATELLRTRDPSVNARYHYEVNSRAYRDRVAEVVASTRAVPAFHNDVADIAALEKQGVATAHARDFAIIGCVELGVPGRSYDASSSIILNLVSALELALYRGRRPVVGDDLVGPETPDPATLGSFEEFWDVYKTQLGWLIEQAVTLNEALGRVHQERLPSPLLSAFYEGPLEQGKDLILGGALYNSSGATHIGFADTVDSLNAIEAAVFRDRHCTFAELLEALRADFQGREALHAWLVHRAPKYGTDDPVAVKNARNLVRFLYDTYQARTNYRGGRYRPAFWTMTNHAGQGKLTGALPNGRRAFKPFASGITPVSQAAADLAGCLEAVARLDGSRIPGGVALNLKYPEVRTPEDLARFGDAVESYFRLGGLQVQFNVMSYEMLLDARAHPERYPDLLIRVSGYSAYFKDLNDAMKDEIITRTAYDLQSGRAVPFPADSEALLPTSDEPASAAK